MYGLALGTTCAGCEVGGRPWCPRCREELAEQVGVHQIGEHPTTLAALPYRRPVTGAVVGYKDRGLLAVEPDLAAALAVVVRESVADCADRRPLVVPVPSSRSAVRRRGMAHVLRLARRALDLLGDDRLAVADILTQRGGRDQAGLTYRSRRGNRAGAFRVAAAPAGPVVLVDDVLTSGATLAACTAACRSRGVEVLAGCVIASPKVTPDSRWLSSEG